MKIKTLLFLGLLISGISVAQPVGLGNANAIVRDLALLPEQRLAAAVTDSIEIWNYKTKTRIRSWAAGNIIALDFRYGKLAGVSQSGHLFVWDVTSGIPLRMQKLSSTRLISVAWADSLTLAAGSESGQLFFFHETSSAVEEVHPGKSAISALTAVPKKGWVVAGDAAGTISVVRTIDGKVMSAAKAHTNWIRDLSFNEATGKLLSVSDDGTRKVWSLGPDIRLVNKDWRLGWITSCDMTNDKATVIQVTGTRRGDLKVFLAIGQYFYTTNGMINSIVILKDELPKLVVAVGTHGAGIQIIDMKSMTLSKH